MTIKLLSLTWILVLLNVCGCKDAPKKNTLAEEVKTMRQEV
jgi:hypothetical protein